MAHAPKAHGMWSRLRALALTGGALHRVRDEAALKARGDAAAARDAGREGGAPRRYVAVCVGLARRDARRGVELRANVPVEARAEAGKEEVVSE